MQSNSFMASARICMLQIFHFVLFLVTSSNISLSVRPAFKDREIVSLALYSFVFIVGTVGNVWVIHRFASISAAGSKFVQVLACVDFLSSIWVPFLRITYTVCTYDKVHHWPLGEASCRILQFCYQPLFYISAWLLVAISADRLR